MADRYGGKSGSVAVGTNKTLLSLISAATVRPRLYEFNIGCVATPADGATHWAIMRMTAVGTEGSGFTPTKLDPGSPASLCDCGQGVFGVEPTITANSEMWDQSINQRASWRWVAAPGGEIIAPATAANGLVLRALSSTGTTAHEASFNWNE